jgi:Rod binding domain-containing protein
MTDLSFDARVRTASAAAGGPAQPAAASDPAKIRQTASDFEAVFVAEMLKPMFDETDAEAPFGGGLAEDVWRSLQVQEFGKAIARSGGIGLADDIEREMLRLRETGIDRDNKRSADR